MQSFSFLRVVRRPLLSCLAGALLASLAGAASQPVGVFPIPLHGSADTYISIPLERGPLAIAPILSAQDARITLPSGAVRTLEEAPLGTYHYVVFRSGALAGWEIPILAIEGDTLTLGPKAEDLNQVQAGDTVALVPYWTPATLCAHFEVPDRTSLFVYDTEGPGLNKTPADILTYFEGYGWYDGNFAPADDFPLRRGDGLVVRLPRGTESGFLEVVGHVPLTPFRRHFFGHNAGRGTDSHFGLSVPVGVTLGNCNYNSLIARACLSTARTAATTRRHQ
ncbi:MAG: TIGR02597 family protein [Verrucomicrobiota bacterium]